MRTEGCEGLEKNVKEKEIFDKTPVGSGAARPEAKREVEVLRFGMEGYCVNGSTLFSDLGDECEPETGFVLIIKSAWLRTIRNTDLVVRRDQPKSAHDVFWMRVMENAVRSVDSVMAPGTHAHTLYLNLMFYRWSKSLRAAKKR